MQRQLQALPQIEGAHPVQVNTLLTRFVGFTGELDQELNNPTAQKVIDLTRSKPKIIPPEWAQDHARKSISKIPVNVRIIAVLIFLSILRTTNTIPDLTNPIPSHSTTESVSTNDESTVNTNKQTPTTKQRKYERLTGHDSINSSNISSFNTNSRMIEME
ncbi:MAG: hypothetical protein EZS28_035120 [Streblomastix strix]|uniref:Uncharacterized protein n=1 Tax=Streblomastix strix TaxID=222440 RepID=A0A5J4UGJ5_9EUKA|nr:MAG: hypothetical protein EZS28_035120 [Streblomastix strix]